MKVYKTTSPAGMSRLYSDGPSASGLANFYDPGDTDRISLLSSPLSTPASHGG